jgi:hypothetical protein
MNKLCSHFTLLQCPYCAKRFLTPFYLHAHIQRRHQGLPLYPQTFTSVPLNNIVGATTTTTSKEASPSAFAHGINGGTSLTPLNHPNLSPNVPAIYAFSMNPNGNVGGENVNLNLHSSVMPTRRRDSSTQTLIAASSRTITGNERDLEKDHSTCIPPSSAKSEGEIEKRVGIAQSDQNNGNNIPLGHKEKSRVGLTTLANDATNNTAELNASSEVVTVIKSPPLPSSWSQGDERHERNTNEDGGEAQGEKYNYYDDCNNLAFATASSSVHTNHAKTSSLGLSNNAANNATTPSTCSSPTVVVSPMDIKTICELIENYLEQKSVVSQNQQYDKILSSIQASRERLSQGDKGYGESSDEQDGVNGYKMRRESSSVGSWSVERAHHDKSEDKALNQNSTVTLTALLKAVEPRGTTQHRNETPNGSRGQTDKKNDHATADTISLSRTEQVERDVMRMKDEFEAQWKHLSDRVRDSGIEQLKGTLLTEIKVSI